MQRPCGPFNISLSFLAACKYESEYLVKLLHC